MRKGKSLTALLLALVLCLSVLPAGVLASEAEAEEPQATETGELVQEPEEDVSPSTMAAMSGKCGENLTWKLDSKGILTISGKGEMRNWSKDDGSLRWDGTSWHFNSEKIVSVVIKNGVTSIGDGAFYTCKNLTSIAIPNSVIRIGNWAFAGCVKLTKLTIPNSVTNIGDYAVYNCNGLTSISIPASVTSIGSYPFAECSRLNNISVASGNKNYSSDKGVLYNKKKTELVRYPAGKKGSYVIPEGVTDIHDLAFNQCKSLSGVSFPNSLRYIGKFAFSVDTGITSITIPAGVTSIDDAAFSLCDNLTRIYFKGNAPTLIEDDGTSGPLKARYGTFCNVTATAYYPKGNKTWTSSKRKSYGGKLTWKTWSPNQPKGVSLVSVTNQKGKKLKVTWKKNAAATGYEVQYSTSSKFKSAKKGKIKKASTTSTTISKLTKGKKYYVRIRTYKTVSGKNYYSGWSKVKTATVKK